MGMNPEASSVMNFFSKYQRFCNRQLFDYTLKNPWLNMIHDLTAMRMQNVLSTLRKSMGFGGWSCFGGMNIKIYPLEN